MDRLLRFLYAKILPVRLRTTLDLFPSLRGKVTEPEVIEKPAGAKVLVLSPHQDDDVIGAGGTLHKHHLAGDSIVSVYMTDGRKGGNGSTSEEEVVRIRREEARRAAKIVGIDRLVFMENRDQGLSPSGKTVGELVAVIKEVEPDVIYLPSVLDYHPDHIATNAIFVSALNRLRSIHCTCYGYEIWSPLVPNCVVRITEHAKVKQAALEQYESQIACFNLVEAAFGLSRYRGVMYSRGDHYAEAFLRCNPKEYARLWRVAGW